jgi:hypothetical protein
MLAAAPLPIAVEYIEHGSEPHEPEEEANRERQA